MDPITTSGAIELTSRVVSKMKAAQSAANGAASILNNRSLVDVASVARVEPITMVDADVINVDCLQDLMQSLHSVFSGYYLQAVAMMGTIGEISVAQRLAQLNPNRALGFESMYIETKKIQQNTQFKHRLPLTAHKRDVALEDNDNSKLALAPSDKAIESIKEAANLSVGKMLNVQLRDGPVTATIPISIRLMVNIIPTRMMVELFTYRDGFDMDMKERYHAWKAGRLGFIRDLILCNDLIDKRRKAAVKDTKGILSMINNRESGNAFAGFMNAKASVATASNIAVVSSETLDQIELAINGRIESKKTRDAIFSNTNLMLLAVVNRSWQRVQIYTRGIDGYTDLSWKDLKNPSKDSGSQVTDILKAYMLGTAPNQ
jgi:hypothetical protein